MAGSESYESSSSSSMEVSESSASSLESSGGTAENVAETPEDFDDCAVEGSSDADLESGMETSEGVEESPKESSENPEDYDDCAVTEETPLEAEEAKEGEEAPEYKSLDEALENASEEERAIYNDANVERSEVEGRECLVRTDVDYERQDETGETNLQKMERGNAPHIDDKPVELHHIGQSMDAPLAELTEQEHRGVGNDAILHDKTKPSEIDRSAFLREKKAHWKARAEEMKGGR